MRRRAFLTGLATALAAPAIVKAENLMKIAAVRENVLNGSVIMLGPDRVFDLGGRRKVIGVWEWREVSLGYSIIRNDLAAPIPTRLLIAKRAIAQFNQQLAEGDTLIHSPATLAT